MERVENINETPAARSGKLLKILGVGFGLAVGIGATIGVGILRNPSGVAAQLGSPWLIMMAWFLGGVYCLLGANFVAELATMIPKAGGILCFCGTRVRALRRFLRRLERLERRHSGAFLYQCRLRRIRRQTFRTRHLRRQNIFQRFDFGCHHDFKSARRSRGQRNAENNEFFESRRADCFCRRLFCFRRAI